MKKIILRIDGMTCSACSNSLEKYLNKQDGIKASVNLVMASATITYDEKKVSLEDIDKYINQVGFKSLGEYKFENKIDKKKIIIFSCIFIIYTLLMIINHLFKIFNHSIFGIISLIISIIFIAYGFDLIRNGIKNIRYKNPNMESLVTIGVISSFIYSLVNLILIVFFHKDLYLYFESVIMIIYFVKLGRFIEEISKYKTSSAIRNLVEITPKTALFKSKYKNLEITIDEVKKGDILVCKSGMKFAVDGIITKGNTYVDEGFITGESNPKKREKGDRVIAGSMNLSNNIEYKATNIGKDSMVSEIVNLVNDSINNKPKISRIADKISSYFVPIIFIIALLTFIVYLIIGKSFNEAIITFVTILVISCPCAMGLATPLAIVVASGKCASMGILLKSSEILEITNSTNKIIFDKTGTLTYGDIRISRLANYSNYDNEKLLNIVASLESNSTHPIANAFKEYENRYNVEDFKNIEGMGISGVVGRKKFYVGSNKLVNLLKIDNNYLEIENNFLSLGTNVLYIIENTNIIGLIGVKDIVRKNSKKVIEKLKEMKKDIYILSGDNLETTSIIAKSLNIDNINSNLLPKDKQNHLISIKNNDKVMMVGDGINDAPSLSIADIGVSINGTDISKNASDVILLDNDLNKIIDLFIISKKTIKIIKENLIFALFYNILMIPIAIGLLKKYNIILNPSIASLMMTLSSLTVVINSLRLKK